MASVTALPPSLHHQHSIPIAQESHVGSPQTSSIPVSKDPVPRGPVTTTINFFSLPLDGSKPYNFVEKPTNGEPQRNYPDADQTVHIQDIRGREKEFALDTHAFATLQGHPHNPAIDWKDDESIKKHYYPEVERLLKESTGGDRVLLFDHTIRLSKPDAHRAPVNRAHIDQTPKSAKQRVEYHLPEEAGKLLQGRYRIINVWRPLNGSVETNPLAFADSTTVPDSDMVGIEHRYPHRTGETAGVLYNPDHSWHYWSGIDNDERILLQCFDSKSPMNRVPHSAFVDPRVTAQNKPRESIEVRALVFG